MQLRKHTVYLAGSQCALRPMTEDDWPLLLRWNNDPDVLYYSEGEDVSGRTMAEIQAIYRHISQREEEWLVWPSFLQGYQATSKRRLTERDFQAILAMNHFYYQIRLCRWGKWNGAPTQTGSLQCATRVADGYVKAMKSSCESLRDWVDLQQWFSTL